MRTDTIEAKFVDVDSCIRKAHAALNEAVAYLRSSDADISDGLIFQWMCRYPDEAASVMADAYAVWDAYEPERWADVLRDHVGEAMEKLP